MGDAQSFGLEVPGHDRPAAEGLADCQPDAGLGLGRPVRTPEHGVRNRGASTASIIRTDFPTPSSRLDNKSVDRRTEYALGVAAG